MTGLPWLKIVSSQTYSIFSFIYCCKAFNLASISDISTDLLSDLSCAALLPVVIRKIYHHADEMHISSKTKRQWDKYAVVPAFVITVALWSSLLSFKLRGYMHGSSRGLLKVLKQSSSIRAAFMCLHHKMARRLPLLRYKDIKTVATSDPLSIGQFLSFTIPLCS